MWLGTFEINAVGCLVLGYLFGLMIAKPNLLPENLKHRNNDGVFRRTYHFFTFNLETFIFIEDPILNFNPFPNERGFLFDYIGWKISP